MAGSTRASESAERRWRALRRAARARLAPFGAVVLVTALAMAFGAPVLSPYDPLKQNLQTRGGAIVAYNTLKKLKKDVANDVKYVKGILEELKGASNFATFGAISARELEGRISSIGDAQSLAQKIQSQIRARSNDGRLAEHSSLDTILVSKLLGK